MVESGAPSQERNLRHFVNPNHPACAAKERDLFISWRSDPFLYQACIRRGIASLAFFHSFIGRATVPEKGEVVGDFFIFS